MWVLRTTDTETPRILRVTAGSTRTVGRGPRADFVVDATLLSRMHCRLVATDSTLTVEDLKSTNGVFVNGARVARMRLKTGDILRVGRLELTVALGESP